MSDAAARVHHPFSPSKLQCLEACPKFQSKHTESEAAAMGTRQHNAAESGEDDAELPDEKAMAVAQCLAFVDERRAKYPGHLLLKEVYVPIDEETVLAPDGTPFEGTTAGFLDVAILSADQKTVEVIDFKYGKFGVEAAANNLQGMAYLLGLCKRYPTIERGYVWFVLPHRDEVTGCEFVRDQFDGIRVRIRTVVGRAVEANKRPEDFSLASPNQSACLFCALVGKCPAVAEVALRVGKKYSPLLIPESVSTSVFVDPTAVSEGLRLAAVIKAWAEDYRAQVTAKTINSDFVPAGYTLVSTVRRSVKDAKSLGELAKTYLPEGDRAKVEALYDLPIGKVEKLISLAAPRGSKERTVEDFGKAALAVGVVKEGLPFAFLRQSEGEKP